MTDKLVYKLEKTIMICYQKLFYTQEFEKKII